MSTHAMDSDPVYLIKPAKPKLLWNYRVLVISGFAAVCCVALLRSLGGLQLLELAAFDRLLQLRPQEPPDDRIVLVGFNEQDFKQLGNAQISDQVLATVLTKIRAQKPRVIGLDMFRNLPVNPGHDSLLKVFRTTPNLIGIQKMIGVNQGEDVEGNPILVKDDRIAASDIVADVDGRVRRSILFPNVDEPNKPPLESLGLRVAVNYLERTGITPLEDSEEYQLRPVKFPRFHGNDGGYFNADSEGYQILLNPRGRRGSFNTVAVRDVLNGTVSPAAFRDRIVLVGDTSAGASDIFYGSYSSASGSIPEGLSGIEMHANFASQILSSVLNQRPLMRTLPKPAEWALIIGLTAASAWLAGQRLSHATKIGLVLLTTNLLIFGCYGALIYGWWLPIVPIVLGVLIATAAAMTLEAQQLTILSNQDGLTLLANRRMFDETLQREWYRCLRSQVPLGLILCDVDYFKPYNDTYGHAKGDECLRQVSQALRLAVKRPMDLTARYGGEEFVILLPNTDLHGAMRVAKLIQLEVQNLQLDHSGSRVSPFVTLSLGVTSMVPSTQAFPDTLLQTADAGLYEAKRKGRNQAVLKLPEEPLRDR